MRISLLFLALCNCATTQSMPQHSTLRIFLARHGQTEWNAERRLQGGTDVPLNETGQKQARELAARLSGVALDHIYTSALQRTRQTAAALGATTPTNAVVALNEQSLGKFEGIYLDGRNTEAATEFERRSASPSDALDGGESAEQHYARVSSAVSALRAQHRAGAILIVGHGGTNALILRALLDLTADEAQQVSQSNDELYLVEVRDHQPPLLWKLIGREQLGAL